MYNRLKKIAKQTLPKQTLQKFENNLRWAISLRYRGSSYTCNVCDTGLSDFVSLESGDQLCPACGSRSRSRRLYEYMTEQKLAQGKLLHFSPPKALYKRLKNLEGLDYHATDFENEFTADYRYDITNIPVADQFFDTIICYHVLEHIPEDKLAIQELYRVLKSGGNCIIQTPFKDGETYEDSTITTPEERLKAFGQEDHVRIYSVEGLQSRLEGAGFSVEAARFRESENHPNGFRSETVLIASKL